MDEERKRQKVDAIIDHAFEGLHNWQPPTPMGGVGPGFPNIYDEFGAELRRLRQDISQYLLNLEDTQLDQNFGVSTAARFNQLFDVNGLLAKFARRLVGLKKRLPADYVGGWAIEEKRLTLGIGVVTRQLSWLP